MHRDGQPTRRLSARRDRKGAWEEGGGRAIPNDKGDNRAVAEGRAAGYTVTIPSLPATKMVVGREDPDGQGRCHHVPANAPAPTDM